MYLLKGGRRERGKGEEGSLVRTLVSGPELTDRVRGG